jgi:hypothetical protein
MTRRAQTILTSISVAVVAAIIVVVSEDRRRLYEAARLSTDTEFDEFASRNGSIMGVRRNHGATTLIVQVPYTLLPFVAREFRWCMEYRETEFTFESEIVSRSR